MRRLMLALGVGLIGGCTPPPVGIPGPTLPWWLVLMIIGGFVLYAYLRKRK